MSITTETANPIQLRFASFPELRLDVRRIQVRHSISSLWEAQVIATVRTPDLPFEELVDRGAALAILLPGGIRLWTGLCADFALRAAYDDAENVYRLKIVPELHRAKLVSNSRSFQHASILEIVLEILENWGFSLGSNVLLRNASVSDLERFPKYEYRVQYEESDYAFICRLLEEAGVSFYFEFANATENEAGETTGRQLTRLVLDADPQLVSAQKPVLTMPYVGSHNEEDDFAHEGRYVMNARAQRSVRGGAVTLIDHDFRSGLGARNAQTSKVKGLKTQEASYATFDYAPGLLHREKVLAQGDAIEKDENARRAYDLLSARRATALEVFFDTSELTVCPGTVVQFGGQATGVEHPREELAADRKHLVVATEIDGGPNDKWLVKCRAVDASHDYRPLPSTPKPRIYGIQSAIVVGSKTDSTEQIFVDDFGRVRVQFHWDRQRRHGEELDENAGKKVEVLGSCWVRVAMPSAGREYGFQALPRVGHEVVVTFLDGDPDRPVVLRSLHNSPSPSPFGTSSTISGLRSSSSPSAEGFNELSFDDAKGAERISVQAENAMSTIVKATEGHDVGKTRRTRIGAVESHSVKDEWRLIAGDDQTGIFVSAANEILVQCGGANGAHVKLTETAIHLFASRDIHFHSDKDIHFSGMTSIEICSDPAQKVHLNDPDTRPQAVTCLGFPSPDPPTPGDTIRAGKKGEGPGGIPPWPGQMAADVDFAPPEPPPPSADPAPESGQPSVLGVGGSGGSGGNTAQLQSPPGAWKPDAVPFDQLQRLPGQVLMQEEGMSCGPAAMRMMLESHTGKQMSEAALREACAADPHCDYSAVNGSNIGGLAKVLQAQGANVTPAKYLQGGDPEAGMAEIAKATAGGKPALAALSGTGGHFVVVDRVFSEGGKRWVDVRDPATSQPVRMSEEQFTYDYRGDGGSRHFSGLAILPEGP